MSVSPPRPKGPHLNALRAFEAAGRLGSFVLAAEELGVTPGAVSQHVKALEDWSEGKLFQRSAKGVALTPLGEELLPDFVRAFDQLSAAVHSLRAKSGSGRLSIATLPAIAQLWLPERLGRFRLDQPDAVVSVTALEAPPNLCRATFDVSIFLTETSQLDPNDIIIATDTIFPVCTPDIAARLADPGELVNETLLRDAVWSNDWNLWRQGLPSANWGGATGPVYSLYGVALEEACNGAGVLMGHGILVQQRIRAGQLVDPFGIKTPSGLSLVFKAAETFRASPLCDDFLAALGIDGNNTDVP